MHAVLPVLAVLLAIVIAWYAASAWLNIGWARQQLEREGTPATFSALVSNTMTQERPVLPAPHQVAKGLWEGIAGQKITSKRSLVWHGWITLSATLLGFAFGSGLGILLAVFIVHNRASDRALMPWIIASQTVPILAIAPMIIVVLNAVGIAGLIPKALISTYLSFFPVVVGMVKGFRSPEQIQLDLMRTYRATRLQTFFKLRWPIAVPYLFTSMKVAIAASLVGAIVGELPAGGGSGLGARLLAGSYYGQTVQIWSALTVASVLAGALVLVVGLVETVVVRSMGARPA